MNEQRAYPCETPLLLNLMCLPQSDSKENKLIKTLLALDGVRTMRQAFKLLWSKFELDKLLLDDVRPLISGARAHARWLIDSPTCTQSTVDKDTLVQHAWIVRGILLDRLFKSVRLQCPSKLYVLLPPVLHKIYAPGRSESAAAYNHAPLLSSCTRYQLHALRWPP
jgi:hypothetical protein